MDLIYCAGKNARYEAAAHAAGFKIGAQLPATVYHPVYFADQDWRRPDRARYMAALAQHRPVVATVLDWERRDQLDEVLSWAEEAAQYVQRVIIIPKVLSWNNPLDLLPRRVGGADVVIGYSVPTRHGGTDLPLSYFERWPVHLLGGSPHAQMRLARRLNVVSADGNMHQLQSQSGRFWSAEKGSKGHWRQLREIGIDLPTDNNLEAFRLSCENIAAAWRAQLCDVSH